MSATDATEAAVPATEEVKLGEFVFPDGSRFSELRLSTVRVHRPSNSFFIFAPRIAPLYIATGGEYVLRDEKPVRHGKGSQVSIS